MAGDGILSGSGVVSERRSCVKRRERKLVVVGVVLHALYMLSIFDIYFKTPIVHGMDPVEPRFSSAPAKRLVLLVADGLRADKFFEPDSEGHFRAPFLRNIIKTKGRWGVSHARPPTESRPGHVSIIAGFYEDPSAVTKGWKANPVEFDSVFNRSRHTFAFGSPDIIPIFCSAVPHSTWNTYPHEFEDFASDASFLDQWSFDQFHSLLNRSNGDSKLHELIQQDKVVIFLHLLGCDTNGHAHRPFSSIYLNNVKVVDSIAEKVHNLMEGYFQDNQTAYIFTADHGMSDKGSHGDGHPTNTDTPLVAWGAGVQNPKRLFHNNHPADDGLRFVDEHRHDMPTPSDWGLMDVERMDVNQADISPLMATLIGLPCPVNSVGNLPLGYIDLSKADEVEAALANTKQILNQFLRKSYMKQSNSMFFKPFKALANYSLNLDQIEDLISKKDFDSAMKHSQILRSLSLDGLHYFQTYDWFLLMTTVTIGYIGWMIYLILHIMQFYTSFSMNLPRKKMHAPIERSTMKVHVGGFLLMGILSTILYLENSPPLYHAYIGMTVFLWTQIFSEIYILKELWRHWARKKLQLISKFFSTCIVSLLVLEFLVATFSERKLYTWCFLISGAGGTFYIIFSFPRRTTIAAYILMTCWFLSGFTMMPAEIPDNTPLVVASGIVVILIGMAVRWFESTTKGDKYWSCIAQCDQPISRSTKLFILQVFLVGLSAMMVWLSTSHRALNKELLTLHQFINWFLAGLSMVLPLYSQTSLLSRLSSVFLGFSPPFLLLSIGYEALFYCALGLVLLGWIMIECLVLYLNKEKEFPTIISDEDEFLVNHDERYLQLSDLRVPLIFMVLFNVAFFGTGNFASIASFEISSVYRFITVFSPYLMSALLIFKLFIPFMLVICVFSAITKLIKIPRLGCYFIVIIFSDVMTIHFFFLVRNTGSWMEIGNSISHFGIMSAQVVFVLLLFALTNIYTKDIRTWSAKSLSRKAI
ncbi:hypothetical protein QJS10_CPA08g01633 [Acorus calamus]|uniref:GPI ethanolamine phosphate transferase 1 n=1 Tax=Acorus calamus TaxID=4465 RepID=A0AAV9E9M7_ACOCL|nr:hypothetical protein QJS10_CPA08g01633 [Acorus calamus]